MRAPGFILALAALAFPALALRAEPKPLPQPALLEALTQEIAAHYNREGEWQLELSRGWTTPAATAERWRVTVLDFPATPGSSMLVRCHIDGDAPLGDFSFILHAALWADAWATQQPLVPGAPFDVTSLETRRVDFLREHDIVPTTISGRSYNFARALPTGRLLTWHDLVRRPLVRKGDSVEVSAAEGALLITMKALCLENGAEGDTVAVRNPESRKEFSARVIDQNHVQIQF